MSEARIQNLRRMYKKYKASDKPVAASRVLDRLRELGVSEADIDNLKQESI